MVCGGHVASSAEDGLGDPAERALYFAHAIVCRGGCQHETGTEVRAVVCDGLWRDLVGEVGAAAHDDEWSGEAMEAHWNRCDEHMDPKQTTAAPRYERWGDDDIEKQKKN